jgi:MFS family permease
MAEIVRAGSRPGGARGPFVVIAATLTLFLFGAIALQSAAMVSFLLADGTPALFVARIVQGIATGAATGALSAALIDLQPPGSTLGALTASVAPAAGLALGAVGAGVLVQLAGDPLRLVFWLQLAALALAAILVYVVSYLAFAIPAVLAGLAATHWGLRDSASGYAVAVVALAACAAWLTMRRPAVHQSPVPSPPLNGPTTSPEIQPP